VGVADRGRHWAQRQRRLEDRTWPQVFEGATTRGRSSIPLTGWTWALDRKDGNAIQLLCDAAHSAVYALALCVFSTFMYCIKMCLQIFSLSGSWPILVLARETLWRNSDGSPISGRRMKVGYETNHNIWLVLSHWTMFVCLMHLSDWCGAVERNISQWISCWSLWAAVL